MVPTPTFALIRLQSVIRPILNFNLLYVPCYTKIDSDVNRLYATFR
jgi:hypothetical protein